MKAGLLMGKQENPQEKNDIYEYSEEEKIRAAYALNMCMVSISQIIDYDDQNILEQEYEGILNNINLEMMPKDEALLTIIKRILDTITFFRIQEGDKKLLDKEYQHKMKNAIWNAIPNFGLIAVGGSPVSLVISLASQIGIGYMNYRRAKSQIVLENEKQEWALQRSAMEQFNGLRRELFDTAWRLADTYKFPDEYRLTEKQIKQYDEILMDPDEIRKYERLNTLKDKFVAYPPFWYHFGSIANHISRNEELYISEDTRKQYRNEALEHFEKYWITNKYALLREDYLAASCALEHIDLLDINKDKEKIEELIEKAVKFSGNSNDILQLCAIAYMKIGDKEKASDLFRILVNEQYNTTVNAQILSGLYVSNVINNSPEAQISRSKYDVLRTRVNPDYLIRMPQVDESVGEEELKDEFLENQEDMLIAKFDSVIDLYFNNFSIRLGKTVPAPDGRKEYPDYYYSKTGIEQRVKDFRELFSSPLYKQKKAEYLERLANSGFLSAYFAEINKAFGDILELNCIRDRQRLQELVSDNIRQYSDGINELVKSIEERTVDEKEILRILIFTSTAMFDDLINELKNQIHLTITGMDTMANYCITDTGLRTFCKDHNLPDPDSLIIDGAVAVPDGDMDKTYFGFDLLGEEGLKYQKEQSIYREIEGIIREHVTKVNARKDKVVAYFHDSKEFNEFFESSRLKNHKGILQKTIAVYKEKLPMSEVILFTAYGIVPVSGNSVKDTIPYILLAGDEKINKMLTLLKADTAAKKNIMDHLMMGLLGPAIFGGMKVGDSYIKSKMLTEFQPMIDEIGQVLVREYITNNPM